MSYILMEGSGRAMGHAVVVYGVGVLDDAHFSVLDPVGSGSTHKNRPIGGIGYPACEPLVLRLVTALVAQRCVDPQSKLHATRWLSARGKQ